MTTFNSHQEIISQLKSLSDKLSKGALNQDELKEFQTLSQALYERAVILNYKAKEESVYKEKGSEKVVKTASKKEESTTTSKVEEAGILFDFSSSENEEEEEVKPLDLTDDNDQTSSKPEENISEEKEKPAKEDTETVKAEVVPEQEESKNITATRETTIQTDDVIYSFYEKFTKVHDDSLLEKLSTQKLDSLKGAFGLNDKMQIISELFNGNSSAFEKALEQLDNQESDEKARLKLSEIAAQHQWEPDHILVEDFAKMVERRYVD